MTSEQITSQGGLTYQQKLIILPVIIEGVESTTNITAYEAEGTGLAYHGVAGDKKDGWVITHLQSKKALCSSVGTEHEVKLLMERVAGIADWNIPEEELKKKTEVGAKFRDCQTSVRKDLNMQLQTAMKDTGMPSYLVETVMDELEDRILRDSLLYAFKIVR